MSSESVIYWPFNPKLLSFLEKRFNMRESFFVESYETGFFPYLLNINHFGLKRQENGKVFCGEMIYRGAVGRNGEERVLAWEPFLEGDFTSCFSGQCIKGYEENSIYIAGFNNASYILINWAKGHSAESIFLEFIPSRRFFRGGDKNLLFERK